jgi:hypothetical protein
MAIEICAGVKAAAVVIRKSFKLTARKNPSYTPAKLIVLKAGGVVVSVRL